MKEKHKYDMARLRHKKIPKPMDKFLKYYMKLIYKSTNETDREINMMLKALVIEEKKNGIANIAKRLFQVSDDNLPYHLCYVINTAWVEFDNIKIMNLDQDTAYIFDIFVLIEEYITESSMDAGIKLADLIKPDNITNHDYILMILKYKFNNFASNLYHFPAKFEDFRRFIKKHVMFFIEETEIDEFLKAYYSLSPKSFVENITKDAKKMITDCYIINKDVFLYALIDIFNAYVLVQSQELKHLTKHHTIINKEIFTSLLQVIDKNIEENIINRIFEEITAEENNFLSISPKFFNIVIMKYGIGGYGVGPFMVKQLQSILHKYLTKDKSKCSIRRNPSDVIPYKISVISEHSDGKPPLGLSQSEVLKVLPLINARIPREIKSRSPSPTPMSNPISKAIVASKFFNSKKRKNSIQS